jgi:hypothetical protein
VNWAEVVRAKPRRVVVVRDASGEVGIEPCSIRGLFCDRVRFRRLFSSEFS